MKKRKILILLLMFLIPSFIIGVPSVQAIVRDETISTIAEKDTFVRQYYPTNNYGGQSYFLVGRDVWGTALETYLYFNFSDKPVNWKSAEIAFDLYSIDSTVNLSVYLIEDSWEELTLTWNNKPSKGEMIDSFLVSAEKIYKVNVSDYIAGRNNISICLWTPELLSYNQIQGDPKEGYFDPPQLIWTYETAVEITITSPLSTDEWFELNTYTIRWNSTGSIGRVKIELFKGASFVEDITYTYTDNDGEYDFYVSSSKNYNGDTDYHIKITDYDDPNVYDYSDDFSINFWSGTITITSPINTDGWVELNIYTIRWTSTGSIKDVKIELYKGVSFIEEITSLFGYTSNDGEYDFYVSTLEDYKGTNYRIKISNFDNSSQFDWSAYFSINVGSGTITITSPTSSSSWEVGSSQIIYWSTTGTIINVDIEIYKGNVLKYYLYDVSDIGFDFWNIDENIEPGTDWRIKISNSDNSAQFDWSDYFEIYKPGVGGAVPGYNYYIIISMLLTTTVLLIRKRKKAKLKTNFH